MDEANFAERLKNTGRNDACPCGSGKKYKKCHLLEDEKKSHEEFQKQEEEAKAAAKEKEEAENEDGKKAKKVKQDNFAQFKTSNKANPSSKRSNIPRRTGI